jgi:Protein of unknown function (DUF2510)
VTVSGWFADPGGKVNTFRWWNGESWTRWLSADPTAPDPGAEPKPTEPAPAPGVAEPVTADSVDLAALPPPNPADRVVRLPAASAIVAAVVLLTLIAAGAIVSLTADRPLTGPPVDPPPPTSLTAEIAYDPATRKVSFQEMQFTAPAAPFSCRSSPREVPGIFTSWLACSAVVHRNYDRKGGDWVSAVGMGLPDDRLRTSGDLKSIAAQTFRTLLAQSYSTKVTVKKQKTEQLADVAPDGKALLVSAEAHLSVPNLPTKYDRVVLVVAELESGQHVAWYGLRANDSPKDVVQELQDSASTLTAR